MTLGTLQQLNVDLERQLHVAQHASPYTVLSR
jgi:hypothetical protein